MNNLHPILECIAAIYSLLPLGGIVIAGVTRQSAALTKRRLLSPFESIVAHYKVDSG